MLESTPPTSAAPAAGTTGEGTAPFVHDASEPAPDRRAVAGSDEDVFPAVLADVAASLDGLPQGILGGIASAVYGRPRTTKDIDVFLRHGDAERALELLAARGFDVERTNESWIYKAFRDGVLVDLIFRVRCDIYFDDEMEQRCRRVEYAGVELPVVAPEDLVVTKAVVADEESPRHWHDALGVLAVNDLDWDYLVERARKSPNRILSLLHYALSVDLPVSYRAMRTLHDHVTRFEER